MGKPSSSIQTKMGARCWSNGLMAIFFAYATYVQMNDPDSWFWMSLYGFAASSCLTAALLPDPIVTRILFTVLALVAGGTLAQQRWLEGRLQFDPKTELGREGSGASIALAWALQNLLLISLPSMVTYSMVALTAAIVASAYTIPKFYLSAEDTIEHCVGLGFRAGGS